MFDFLKRWGGPYPDFDSIYFDAHGWQLQEQAGASGGPIWKTEQGDPVGLEIIRRRPKLPQAMDLYGYRNVFVRTMQSGRGIPVELGTLRVSECPAIRFIYKTPQKDGGMAYSGTLTLPFKRFSFIFEGFCADHGNTEVRESILAERGVSLPTRKAQEWPPAPRTEQPDMPQFDAEFPQSPVARLRRMLERIGSTATIEASIASLPTCKLPE